MNELPIGCIFCYPSPICPDGFLPCDGRELSKNTYHELYKLIKGTWGETSKTFFLPDLRGLFVRGWDEEGNVDPEREFGSEQDDAIQGHGHELSIKGEISESVLYYDTKTISYGTNTIASNESISFNSILTPSEHQTQVESIKKIVQQCGTLFGNIVRGMSSRLSDIGIKHKHELPDIEVKDAISSTYQKVRISVETRPKNIALMYCIKVK